MFSVRSRISINRIRLEFKGRLCVSSDATLMRINRIRLEFKDLQIICPCFCALVLIESDWNLKLDAAFVHPTNVNVLIESDWNLKHLKLPHLSITGKVLIESDWNLKKNTMELKRLDSQY